MVRIECILINLHIYSSILQEDEYHRLAESTIHDLLEKLEVVDVDYSCIT